MLTLASQLECIFERAGLRPESGRPFFAYRVTEAERDGLAQGLRHAFLRGDHDGVVASAFVLFGASDFCANHRYGTWSWDHIFESTGWSDGAGVRLYDLVVQGLRRFKRPLQSTDYRFAYLGTLACEGGLPLAMLRGRQAGSLKRYFRQLLAVSERYELAAPAILELASELQTILPQSLRNLVVQRMAADLVSAVATLRAEAAAANVEPGDLDVSWLDSHHPEWRLELPLRVDADVADALLRGLLRQSRWDKGASQTFPLVVRLRLASGSNSPCLIERDIDVSPRAQASDLADLLTVDTQALPALFYLFAVDEHGLRQAVATATHITGTETYRLTEARPARPFRDPATLFGPIQVIASVGPRDIGQGLPAGGGAVSKDLPMALLGDFEQGTATLRSAGSARTRASSLDVLCPANLAPVALDGSRIERLEAVLPAGLGLFRVWGVAEWRHGGEHCVFRSQDEDRDVEYVLGGRLHRFGPLGTEAHAGLPRVGQLRQDVLRWLPAGQLEWKPNGAGDGYRRISEGDPIGDVWIRVREHGETLFRTRVLVLPSDLHVTLRTGDETGQVLLRHTRLSAVTVMGSASQGVDIANPESGHFVLSVPSGPDAPDRLCLSLLFAGGREARLTVSSPARAMSFVDLNGESVRDTGIRALDRLGSVRARAVGRGNDCFSLEARRPGGRWRLLADLPAMQSGVFELSLEQIRPTVAQLLAAEGSTDAQVSLRIMRRGAPMQGLPVLNVSRYDGRLEPLRDDEEMPYAVCLDSSARAGLTPETLGALRADIRPLESPSEANALALTCLKPGLFEVPIEDLEPGPWLVVAWDGRWARIRPLLLTIPGTPTSPPDDALGQAIRLTARDERAAAMDACLQSMEDDVSHPSWPRAMEIVASLDDLPTMTFELSSALIRRPRALAMLLLMEAHRLPVLWPRFEELPFLWATLPVDNWLHAFEKLFEQIGKIADEHGTLSKRDLIQSQLGILRDRCQELAPFMHVVLDAAALRWPELVPSKKNRIQVAATDGGLNILLQMEEEAARDALCDGAELRWPQLNFDELTGDPEGVASNVHWLGQRAVQDCHRDVLRAPCLAASLAAGDQIPGAELTIALRTARDFDPHYFQSMHALHLACELADWADRETSRTS